MKKIILCGMALALSLGSFAQELNVRHFQKHIASGHKHFNSTANVKRSPGTGNPHIQAIALKAIGNGPNAFGGSANARTALFAHPVINTVAFFHRNNSTLFGGTSGQIRYDLSTDGGATFTSDLGPIYTATGNAAPPFANGRFPQGAIYNPTGNTTPGNAYLHYFVPTLSGLGGSCGNSGWGGVSYGAMQIFSGTPTASEQLDTTVYIPDDGAMNQGDNSFWTIRKSEDIGNVVCDYLDTLVLSKGTWNGTDYTYVNQTILAPVESRINGGKMFENCRIAWGIDGLTGYVTYIGHESFTDQADSSHYPVVYKTTDGGTSWSRIAALNLQAIDANLGTGAILTVGYDHDLTVDANGNLHMVAPIVPLDVDGGYYSDLPIPGFFAIYDIYTTDGGTSWSAQELGRPNTCYADLDPLLEQNRPQACRSLDGSRLFFGWFDTDLAVQADSNNIQPNFFYVGYNVTSGQYTAMVDATTGTPAEAIMNFGIVSPYALAGSVAGTYKIPVSALNILTDVSSAVTHTYVDGIEVADADYTITGTPVAIVNTAVKVHEIQGISSFAIGQNYPNPFNGETRFDIKLKQAANVSVDVVNILGKLVKSLTFDLSAGESTISINGSDLAAGVYTYTVKVGSEKVSRTMMIK